MTTAKPQDLTIKRSDLVTVLRLLDPELHPQPVDRETTRKEMVDRLYGVLGVRREDWILDIPPVWLIEETL